MRHLSVVLAAFLLLAFATIALPVYPQSGAAQAQKHMVEGERFAQQKKWDEALAAFQKAHEASPSHATATRIANALYQLDRPVAAHRAYESLLRDHGARLLGGEKKTAQSRLDELAGKTGTLAIRVSEAGATVRIDDEPAGTSPLSADVRVLAGSRRVTITKQGFTTFEKTVQMSARGQATLDARLEEPTTTGTLRVEVRGGEGLTVLVDGAEAGPAPWEGPVAPGSHQVAAKSDTLEVRPTRVEVEAGKTAVVVLDAAARTGKLEVRLQDDEGVISVDGKKVADGGYQGELPIGKHELRVTRSGYEPFEKSIEVVADDVHVETVSLRRSARGDVVAERDEGDWTFDGLYGGLQLSGAFQPLGSGHTLDDACDTTGATSCDSGVVAGGSLGGYVGYAFAPLGLEVVIVGAGDAVQPRASFDGVKGSEINPLVAQPAREEEFIIGRFGGGGVIRARLLWPIDRFRVTFAGGVGLVYKFVLLGRDGIAADGRTSETSDDGKGYFSPALSFELGGQVRLGGTTSLAVGLNLWLEHAGSNVKSEPKATVLLTKDGSNEPPAPHATPAYDMAAGTQLFLGPFLGLQFGP